MSFRGEFPAQYYSMKNCAFSNVVKDPFSTAAECNARYHIGESLLRTTGSFLEFVGAYDKFENHGFRQKVRPFQLL